MNEKQRKLKLEKLEFRYVDTQVEMMKLEKEQAKLKKAIEKLREKDPVHFVNQLGEDEINEIVLTYKRANFSIN